MIEKIRTLNRVNYFAVQSTQHNTADPNTLLSAHNEHWIIINYVVPSLAVDVTEGWRKLHNNSLQILCQSNEGSDMMEHGTHMPKETYKIR